VSSLPGDHPDLEVVRALLARDEAAFRALVTRHHAALVRVARQYVSTAGAAEEIAQETWLALVTGLERFEGRSSLKSWIFTILANQARSRGRREQRVLPLSSIVDDGGPTVDPDRFLDAAQRWGGHWASPPRRTDTIPEDALERDEMRTAIRDAVTALAPNQERVLWLRDVEGFTADEVCTMLDLSEANQRVLLHRARAKVRAALEHELHDTFL
jgi:RNA polymerase sigma-70 factor (ECF subfamily)